MKALTIVFALLTLAFFSSCDKEDSNSNIETVLPVIDSLTTNSIRIQFGGGEPAILNCYATGGDLTYIWGVDLGDLFSINDDGSEVQYTASPCCIGEKTITCTVSNDKGEATESVTITITE